MGCVSKWTDPKATYPAPKTALILRMAKASTKRLEALNLTFGTRLHHCFVTRMAISTQTGGNADPVCANLAVLFVKLLLISTATSQPFNLVAAKAATVC